MSDILESVVGSWKPVIPSGVAARPPSRVTGHPVEMPVQEFYTVAMFRCRGKVPTTKLTE